MKIGFRYERRRIYTHFDKKNCLNRCNHIFNAQNQFESEQERKYSQSLKFKAINRQTVLKSSR